MEQLSSIKIKLIFSEYSELVEQFNILVKENQFKPLYYKEYRIITGKTTFAKVPAKLRDDVKRVLTELGYPELAEV